MKRFSTVFASALLLCSLSLAEASARTLLVLGDSLSAAYGIDAEAGWVNLLRQRLAARNPPWRVVNRSISGDTTAGGRARLPALLERYRPEIVIIELGSNDGLRGFGFDQMRANLEAMIEAVEDAGGRVVLVGGRLPPNYGATYADAFHELFKEVAERYQLPLVPFLLEDVARDRSLMLADGYHPNEAAQPRLLENVWSVLEGSL